MDLPWLIDAHADQEYDEVAVDARRYAAIEDGGHERPPLPTRRRWGPARPPQAAPAEPRSEPAAENAASRPVRSFGWEPSGRAPARRAKRVALFSPARGGGRNLAPMRWLSISRRTRLWLVRFLVVFGALNVFGSPLIAWRRAGDAETIDWEALKARQTPFESRMTMLRGGLDAEQYFADAEATLGRPYRADFVRAPRRRRIRGIRPIRCRVAVPQRALFFPGATSRSNIHPA